MNEAVIYTRFSPRPEKAGDAELLAREEDAATIQVQLSACERYCRMQSLTVISVLKDPEVSARKTRLFDRPAGMSLVNLPAGTNIVAAKLDRVFRDTVDGLETIREFERRGIILHFADEGGCSINTSTATGELITTILLARAAHEPRQIAERVSASHHYRQNVLGERMGAIPIGFKLADDGKHIEPCRYEQQLIAEAKRMRKQGYSLVDIGATFHARGWQFRESARWHPQTVSRLCSATNADNINVDHKTGELLCAE